MTIVKIMEIMAKEKKTLSELIGEIPIYEMHKTKINCPNDKKDIVIKKITDQIREDSSIIRLDETDGIKLYVKDGWILMRPSGTEPIFRVYSESKGKVLSEELALKYKKMADRIIKNEGS